MQEFVLTTLGVLATVLSLALLATAVSATDTTKTAVTFAALSIVSGVLALWLFDYAVFAAIRDFVTRPVLVISSVLGYVVAGFTYSFIRWWRVNRYIRQTKAQRFRSFVDVCVARDTRSIINTLLRDYCVRDKDLDPTIKNNLAAVSYGDQCQTLTELAKLVEKISPTLMTQVLNSYRNNKLAPVFQFIYNHEGRPNIVDSIVIAGLLQLPEEWQNMWQNSSKGAVYVNEGFTTKAYALEKPSVTANLDYIASWVALWPACLTVNSVVDFGQLVSNMASAAVQKLSAVYDRLAGSWD